MKRIQKWQTTGGLSKRFTSDNERIKHTQNDKNYFVFNSSQNKCHSYITNQFGISSSHILTIQTAPKASKMISKHKKYPNSLAIKKLRGPLGRDGWLAFLTQYSDTKHACLCAHSAHAVISHISLSLSLSPSPGFCWLGTTKKCRWRTRSFVIYIIPLKGVVIGRRRRHGTKRNQQEREREKKKKKYHRCTLQYFLFFSRKR